MLDTALWLLNCVVIGWFIREFGMALLTDLAHIVRLFLPQRWLR